MSYNFENMRVLIVEDNKPMMELVKSLLKTFGVETIFSATNGREGFKAFCEENIDIVIADWMMSPMDGIALTQEIRNNPDSPNPFVPMILITGFSEKRRVLEARDIGVTEFLVKPFNVRDLYKRIYQVIERPRQFIKSDEFFGPDRRRLGKERYTGSLKRFDDENADSFDIADQYIDTIGGAPR